MSLKSEIEAKHERVRQFLHSHHLDGVLLSTSHNFAWFTAGGANCVNSASTIGAAQLLVSADRRTIISNNIENPRLVAEEDAAESFAFEQYPWHDQHQQSEIMRKLAAGKRLACDGGIPGIQLLPQDFDSLRYTLIDDEVSRFREVCRDTGQAIGDAARSVELGQTELDVAAVLARQCHGNGLLPIVLLVAADERIASFRHPLPTSKRVTGYVELVVSTRRKGLCAAATRLVHFGDIPDDLRKRHDAVMTVDTAAILGTRPHRRVRDVFDDIRSTYARTGFADEWKLHHQGGLISYQPWEYIAGPADTHTVELNQAFAWNPSITGTKSEDTILVTEFGFEVLTNSPDWPLEQIIIGDRAVYRPGILVK